MSDIQQWVAQMRETIQQFDFNEQYAVPTNWWNEYQNYLFMTEEGIQYDVPEFSNEILEQSESKETREKLHERIASIVSPKAIQITDFYFLNPAANLNVDYSLIGRSTYYFLTQHIPNVQPIRVFIEDETLLVNAPNIVAIPQSKNGFNMDVLRLGIIINYQNKSCAEVGYYQLNTPLTRVMFLIAQNYPQLDVANVTMNFSHAQTAPNNEVLPQVSFVIPPNSNMSSCTLSELGVLADSIIIFSEVTSSSSTVNAHKIKPQQMFSEENSIEDILESSERQQGYSGISSLPSVVPIEELAPNPASNLPLNNDDDQGHDNDTTDMSRNTADGAGESEESKATQENTEGTSSEASNRDQNGSFFQDPVNNNNNNNNQPMNVINENTQLPQTGALNSNQLIDRSQPIIVGSVIGKNILEGIEEIGMVAERVNPFISFAPSEDLIVEIKSVSFLAESNPHKHHFTRLSDSQIINNLKQITLKLAQQIANLQVNRLMRN